MATNGGRKVTWTELVATARQLGEAAAAQREVKAEDAVRFVRMLLRFDRQLDEPVRAPR